MFDINTMFSNLFNMLQTWGGYIVLIIGTIMIIVGIYQVAKGLIQHGKGQTNWVVAIALILVGGAFIAGGTSSGAWDWVKGVAKSGQNTINDLGGGNLAQGVSMTIDAGDYVIEVPGIE